MAGTDPPDLTKIIAGLLVLVLTIFVYEWAVLNNLASPLLATTSPLMRYLCYTLLLVTAAGSFAYDWNEMGPTLALKRGVVSTLVAWILIVPLGVVSEVFLNSVWFVAILGLGAYAASVLFRKVNGALGLFVAVCILLISWVLATHQSQFRELEHVLGIVFIFLGISVAVRLATSVAAERFEPVATWPGVTRVEKDSEEFREQMDFFEAASAQFADKYKFWCQLEELYRLSPPGPESQRPSLTRTGDGRHLFHGTRRDAAQGIVEEGFRLPNHPGMFGKGVYFADCPLKSWQYTDGMMHVRNGIILLCWVELGRRSHQKAARNHLTRPPRRTFMEWLKQEEKYTSVVGDDKDAGGALRVPEYIIYDPAKAQVDYICEVRCVPPGTAPSQGPPST